MGRFLPPDHSKGDERTLGGYMAVHARPAAFEGRDGLAYSVAIETDATGDPAAPVGAFLLFVRWSESGRGDATVSGHLETDFLARGASDDEVRAAVGAMPLARAKELLDTLVTERATDRRARPWWDVMRDDDEGSGA